MSALAPQRNREAERPDRMSEGIEHEGHLLLAADLQLAPIERQRSCEALAEDRVNVDISHLQVAFDPSGGIGEPDVRGDPGAPSHLGQIIHSMAAAHEHAYIP